MRKTLCAALAIAALGIAAPAAAQYQPDNRGSTARGQSRDSVRNNSSQADLAAADRRLTQIYQRRIAEARAADRAAGRYARGRDWYGQEAALREAERNWIAYRDADCRYASQPDIGRRYYRDLARACLIDRTEERTTVLREQRMDLSSR